MSGLLPASPTARRAEEAIRRRAALERIEGKLDTFVAITKGTAACAAPTPSISDEDVEWAAEALAEPDALRLYPRGSVASVTMSLFDGEPRRMASTITAFPLQPMEIRRGWPDRQRRPPRAARPREDAGRA
jgi:hypothetical protein